LKNYLTRVFKSIFFSILIIAGSSFAQTLSARERDWQPQRTWVYVVGLLKWQHEDLFGSFPQTDRRDAQLVEFFRREGVPREQIVFLKDAQATTRRVHDSFPAFLAKAQPGDLLFFYYTGHGYQSDDQRTTYFATYDAGRNVEGWPTDSIVREVERYFRGSRALLTADTCFSGSLAAQAQKLGRRVSYASLTSASAHQASTENWTFTEMLLAGLRGKSFADLNGDGEVTLSELASDIKDDMAFAENQRSTFVTTGNFPSDMLLASATRRSDPLISQRVEVLSEGSWYKARVIDARGTRYEVHYYGYEDSDDEWVSRQQMRSAPESDGEQRAESDWDTSPTPTRVSRVNQDNKNDERWDSSPRRRRSTWNAKPSGDGSPPVKEPRRRPRPSWNN